MTTTLKTMEARKVTAEISVNCDPELKRILSDAADEANVSLSEHVTAIIANAIDRPDLAKVPRKKIGRPRKEVTR